MHSTVAKVLTSDKNVILLATESAQIIANAVKPSNWEVTGIFLSGVGQFLLGLGGLAFIFTKLDEYKQNQKIKKLKQKYPIENIEKDFEIVDIARGGGHYFLADNRNKTCHHISNPQTMTDLDFYSQQPKFKQWTKQKLTKNYDLKGKIITKN